MGIKNFRKNIFQRPIIVTPQRLEINPFDTKRILCKDLDYMNRVSEVKTLCTMDELLKMYLKI